MADENWPSQKPIFSLNKLPSILSSPPYGKDTFFKLPDKSYFFKERLSLDSFLNGETSIEELILSKRAYILPKSHIVRAQEDIVSFQGRVSEKGLGDGYIVMTSRY